MANSLLTIDMITRKALEINYSVSLGGNPSKNNCVNSVNVMVCLYHENTEPRHRRE